MVIFREIIKIESKIERVSEKELMDKVKELLENEKDEYPNFSLTTMVMDAFNGGGSVFKIEKRISSNSPLQESFLEA